jgi:hypothetical protein
MDAMSAQESAWAFAVTAAIAMGVLGLLGVSFRSDPHIVRTQSGVTARLEVASKQARQRSLAGASFAAVIGAVAGAIHALARAKVGGVVARVAQLAGRDDVVARGPPARMAIATVDSGAHRAARIARSFYLQPLEVSSRAETRHG